GPVRPARLTGIQQRQDVRVLQPRRRADLGEKAFRPEGRAEVGVQHLDGHIALVLEIVGEVDGGHATSPKLALDAVAVGERGGETCGDVCHVLLVAEATARLVSLKRRPLRATNPVASATLAPRRAAAMGPAEPRLSAASRVAMPPCPSSGSMR